MQVTVTLFLDSLNNFGMVVPYVKANETRVEVDVLVAVNIT
jgi:hypothetical protein